MYRIALLIGVASAQVMNINVLSAWTNESPEKAESQDIRVSAGGGERLDWRLEGDWSLFRLEDW